MEDDLVSKPEKDIEDLISIDQGSSQKLTISSEDVEDKLKSKIREIEEKKKEQITRQEAEAQGVGYIYLKGFPINPEALVLISEAEAREIKAVCFFKTDTEVRIGAVDPNNPKVKSVLKRIESNSRARGQVYKISELSFNFALGMYRTIPKIRKVVGGIEITEAELKRFQKEISSFKDIAKSVKQVSATELITVVMAGAIQTNSSDVHIEAEQDDVKVRYRIDGVLYNVASLPNQEWPKIVNRIKLIAKLKLNVVDIPQDGRFTIYLTNEFIDVRVSTIPSAYGESIVMRLLMSTATAFGLDDLGMTGEAFSIIEQEIAKPNGMILTTGPTGSGKTTTLYAVLKKLNTPDKKIITLENPIEYRIKGITQSEVEITESAKNKAGQTKRHFTYANGLRSVLRQDPDIVMVGEIRDQETSEIAIQAALTGHLLLSTLHTNSAAGAIPRLISMSVKPFLLAPALNAVIGQRLVRKICSGCKEEYKPEQNIYDQAMAILESIPPEKLGGVTKENMKFFRGKGCSKCSELGYKGRVGIFEMLTMNEDIEKLILEAKASEHQIQQVAKKYGMLTMAQDGILKVAQGLTSPEEVFRVTK